MINLGYVPGDDFAKGIKEVIQWYKENLQERKNAAVRSWKLCAAASIVWAA